MSLKQARALQCTPRSSRSSELGEFSFVPEAMQSLTAISDVEHEKFKQWQHRYLNIRDFTHSNMLPKLCHRL